MPTLSKSTMRGDKEIREEMEKLAPGFAWPENRPGFDVPAGYFSGFPGRVWNKLKALPGNDMPPEYGKQHPYKIPDGYFDHLPQAVLKKVKKETPAARLPRPRPRWYSWASAAAIGLLVALSALLMFRRNDRQPSIDRQLASLSNTAIEEYLNAEAGFYTRSNSNSSGDDNLPDPAISRFSNKDIETYLINNVPDSL